MRYGDVGRALRHKGAHRTPIEQHVHSFLEMIPLMGLVSAVSFIGGRCLRCSGQGRKPLA
jgi:hypothetical protein